MSEHLQYIERHIQRALINAEKGEVLSVKAALGLVRAYARQNKMAIDESLLHEVETLGFASATHRLMGQLQACSVNGNLSQWETLIPLYHDYCLNSGQKPDGVLVKNLETDACNNGIKLLMDEADKIAQKGQIEDMENLVALIDRWLPKAGKPVDYQHLNNNIRKCYQDSLENRIQFVELLCQKKDFQAAKQQMEMIEQHLQKGYCELDKNRLKALYEKFPENP